MATVEEQIKAAEDKLKQLKAKAQKIEAQKRARLSKQERTNDTRRKILLGALVLDGMNRDADTKTRWIAKLEKSLSRDADRALFDLPAKSPVAAAPASAQPIQQAA